MEPDLVQKIIELEQKVDAVYVSSEKTRKYFLFTIWVTVIMFILPLIGLLFVLPRILNTYMDSFQGLL